MTANTINLLERLCEMGFTAPDVADVAWLIVPNGNKIAFCDVTGPAPRINLFTPLALQIWHVAVHRLPVSIISAILAQAIADNQ